MTLPSSSSSTRVPLHAKSFFESFQQLLQIILFRQTLQSSQGLATVALLDADVDVILLRSDVGILEIAFLGERVEALEVLKTHAMESGSRGCV